MIILGVQIALGLLIALGVLALIGVIALIYAAYTFFSDDDEKVVTVDATWVALPPGDTTIDDSGVDFKVKVFANIEGLSSPANLKNVEVVFKAAKDSVTIKTPVNGKVKTGEDGIATCNFTGSADDSTKIEAKVTIDGKEIPLSAPAGSAEYETSRF